MSQASADCIQFKLSLCALQRCSVFLFGLESTPGPSLYRAASNRTGHGTLRW